jgi:hypothetical protein
MIDPRFGIKIKPMVTPEPVKFNDFFHAGGAHAKKNEFYPPRVVTKPPFSFIINRLSMFSAPRSIFPAGAGFREGFHGSHRPIF